MACLVSSNEVGLRSVIAILSQPAEAKPLAIAAPIPGWHISNTNHKSFVISYRTGPTRSGDDGHTRKRISSSHESVWWLSRSQLCDLL